MNDNVEAAIRAAVAAGTTARQTATNRLILPTPTLHPRSFQVLVRSDGAVTAEGELYFQLTGAHNPQNARFDPNQQVSRRGDTEYILDRAGRTVALRTLQPEGTWRYTAAGRQYYAQ